MKKVNTKRLKFKINNAVVVAFAVICVILLNMVLSLAEDKLPALNIDLTENSLTKLTNETKAFLNMLDKTDTEIEILCLKGTEDVNTLVGEVLSKYDRYSRNITYSEKNYHKNPAVLTSFNISTGQISDGTVIITNTDKTRYRIVLPTDMWSGSEFLLESKVTNAISYVINSESVNVCIATGYGSDDYISPLVESMIDDNFSVSRIDLSATYIPDTIDVLLIISPYADLTESEINNLDSYIKRGGNLIVGLPSYAVSLPNLEAYLKYWGISVNSDLIYEYDESSSYEQSGLGFFASGGQHDINQNVDGRILVTNARSLNYSPVEDLGADVLLGTTGQAVSVPQNKEEITKDDITYGPFDIAYIVERPVNNSYDTTSKLIVTSTPSLWGVDTIDNILSQTRFGNGQFVSNAISYSSGKTVVSVNVPKKTSSENIMMLSNFLSVIFTMLFCVLLPVAVLFCGVIIWLKRRNK